jgi:hypothetical protein
VFRRHRQAAAAPILLVLEPEALIRVRVAMQVSNS